MFKLATCLAIFVTTGVTTGVNAVSFLCRCEPSQPCWPSASDWAALNSSIDGNLFAIRPIAAVCHDPTYDAAACAAVQANTHDSRYRSAQPGAVQYESWEAWPEQNQQCYVESNRSIPCGQGRVSLYSAEVESAAHIQAAVKFAASHNIKLAIKASGHDLLGRSSAPDSLQISTYKLKNITVIPTFVLSGGSSGQPGVKAVTLGAGVQLQDMYAYLGTQGVMVVGGSARTVAAAGGYMQGGGHSIMGFVAGMGADNALEYQIVTADGNLVTANSVQNTDLFYALRGGGGGTWGVVVSATVKAYPDFPVIFTQLNYTLAAPNAAFWAGVEAFHKHLVALNDAGGTGYYYITPINPVPGVGVVSTFVMYTWFVNQTNTAILPPLFEPLISDLTNATGSAPYLRVIPFPSMSSMYAAVFPGSDYEGFLGVIGSRLVSRVFVNSPGAPAKIANALSSLKLGPGDFIEGNVVGGGQVAANANISNAVNPAWRKTLTHILFTRLWDTSTTFAQQAIIRGNVTNDEVPILKSFEPGQMGAYLSEADANEPNFQQSFWGADYYKLYAIKAARDPNGLFISRKGVGSENWDDDGLCHVA